MAPVLMAAAFFILASAPLGVPLESPLYAPLMITFLIALLAWCWMRASLARRRCDRLARMISLNEEKNAQLKAQSRELKMRIERDIRQPLQVVTGYNHLLDTEAAGALNAAQRETVNDIRRQLECLLLVTDLTSEAVPGPSSAYESNEVRPTEAKATEVKQC